jgi:hypothetical protein
MRRVHFVFASLVLIVGQAEAQQPPKQPTSPGQVDPNPRIGDKTLDQWMSDLQHRDPSVRTNALRVIPQFGLPAKKALPRIVWMMANENDNTVRVNALLAVGMAASQNLFDDPKVSRDAVNNLVLVARGTQGVNRLHATAALASFGPTARGAIEQLLVNLRDTTSWEIRKASASTLGRVGRDEQNWALPRVVNALTDRLKEESAILVRVEIYQTLMQLGAPLQPEDLDTEKRAIESRLKSETDRMAQVWGRVTLMRLDPVALSESNLMFIARGLREKDSRHRMVSAEALGVVASFVKADSPGSLGAVARITVGELMQGLQHEDLTFVGMCLWALGCFGPDGGRAADEVQKMTNHTDAGIKIVAKEALDRINGKKK